MANKRYKALIEKVNAKIQKHIQKFNEELEDGESIEYPIIEVGDCFKREIIDAEFDGGTWHDCSSIDRFKLVEKNNRYYLAYCDDKWELDKEDKWMDLLDKEDGFTVKTLFEYLLDEDSPCWNYKKSEC